MSRVPMLQYFSVEGNLILFINKYSLTTKEDLIKNFPKIYGIPTHVVVTALEKLKSNGVVTIANEADSKPEMGFDRHICNLPHYAELTIKGIGELEQLRNLL